MQLGFTTDPNIAIDVLKVFAVLLVLNSHMSICYPQYKFLSTGGAFGDALFFFCSGFTLFLGKLDRFDTWYKRRLSRILPALFTVAIFAGVFFQKGDSIIDILTARRYWFIQAILGYYILLYPIRKYIHRVWPLFIGSILVTFTIYLLFFRDNTSTFIYSNLVFRKILFFIFMLQGALLGRGNQERNCTYIDFFMLFLSIGAWYGIMYVWGNSPIQICSLIPLLGFTYYLFKLCHCKFFERMYHKKYIGDLIYIMGALCLEVYLVQIYLFTTALNYIFPINIPIVMGYIFLVAYALNFCSQLFKAIFEKEPIDYRNLILKK